MEGQAARLHGLDHAVLANARGAGDDDQQRLGIMQVELGFSHGSIVTERQVSKKAIK